MIPVAHKNLLNYTRKLYHNNLKVTIENKGKGTTKRLLHMLISKITKNKTRDIESIELNINNNLISYLSSGGEPSPDGTGGGSPSYFISRRKLMINPVNIKIST